VRGPPARVDIQAAAELASAMVYVRGEQQAEAERGISIAENPWMLCLNDVEEILECARPYERYRALWLACSAAHGGVVWSAEDWLLVEGFLRDALVEGWRR